MGLLSFPFSFRGGLRLPSTARLGLGEPVGLLAAGDLGGEDFEAGGGDLDRLSRPFLAAGDGERDLL